MRPFASKLFSSLQREYATAARKPALRSKGPVLGLDHFLQRQKTLHLWREILRALKLIQAPSTRAELRSYARSEFERHRGVTDLAHIRYLLSTGKTEFDTMKRYVYEQAA